MFHTIVKLVILISISTSIISCRHDDNSTTVKNQDKPVLFTFKTLDQANNPLKNVVVQINNNTEDAKVSNTNGLVTFSNLNKDTKYDIHFFGPTGYTWHSIYNVKLGLINEKSGMLNDIQLNKLTTPEPQPASYIQFEGNISNVSNNYSMTLSYFANYEDLLMGNFYPNTLKGYASSIATSLPIGSKLLGDVWGLETSSNQATSTSYISDAVKYPDVAITTTAKSGKATTQNIAFNTSKPALATLFTINSVLPPVGITQSSLWVQNQFFTSNKISKSKNVMLYTKSVPGNFPLNIDAYDPFKLNNFYLSLTSLFTANVRWVYTQKVANGATVNIQSNFDSLPQIPPNQVGGTIRWNLTSGSNISHQGIEIADITTQNNSQPKWSIIVDKNTSEINLPSLPKSVIPILKQGSNYTVKLGVIASDSSPYTSGKSSIINATFFEQITSDNVAWTR